MSRRRTNLCLAASSFVRPTAAEAAAAITNLAKFAVTLLRILAQIVILMILGIEQGRYLVLLCDAEMLIVDIVLLP